MEILSLQPRHIREILARNLTDEDKHLPVGMGPDDMIKAYLSPGSAAYCIVDRGMVILAGGIINLQWHRGEAWILHTRLFHKHLKTCMKMIKTKLPELARMYNFHRVQATSFIDNERLFQLLGFDLECPSLRLYGPSGETAKLFVRFFEDL